MSSRRPSHKKARAGAKRARRTGRPSTKSRCRAKPAERARRPRRKKARDEAEQA